MPSWSGSAAPSTLDDAGRAFQGAVTREWNWRSYTLTAAGTADAKTLTFSVAPAAYYNGQRFSFIANTTNTGSASLNVNSLGAVTIKKDVSGTLTNLSASEMVSGMFVEVAYNTVGACFVWVNRGATITGLANTWSAVQTFTASPVISVTDNTNAALRVTQLGSGNAFLVEDSANPDSTPFVVTAAGDVGIGTTAPGQKLDVIGTARASASLAVGDTSANLSGSIVNESDASKSIMINADPGNAGASSFIGFKVDGSERARIDSSGNVLVTAAGGLGYGTGSGGTVTQITSKSTAVTLNKTNGRITMSAAALAAGTAVSFQVNNSSLSATDNIILTPYFGAVNPSSYTVRLVSNGGTFFIVSVTNTTGGSLSEALEFNFAIIKGATS
jgi:hypothetical protein